MFKTKQLINNMRYPIEVDQYGIHPECVIRKMDEQYEIIYLNKDRRAIGKFIVKQEDYLLVKKDFDHQILEELTVEQLYEVSIALLKFHGQPIKKNTNKLFKFLSLFQAR